MPISVSDYIFQRVAEYGVRDVFMISGGGIMHLCEALGRSDRLRYWCNYNEQATAIATESYARVVDGLGVCLVTTGPGSTNALSGVAGAWVDSIPILVISGQVRTAIMADYSYQRQVGPQEINILPMVEPITKYAVTVMSADAIRYELEKCLFLAMSGRKGPVWLNVPLDVQAALVEPEALEGYIPDREARVSFDTGVLDHVVDLLREARRPLIIGGNGIVLAGARKEFRDLVERLSMPVLSSISGMDLLPEDYPLFMGRFGPAGQRRANLALQNADFVLAIGTSLSISCVGFNETFAAKARVKILVNIDKGDLEKKNINIDIKIQADAKDFISSLLGKMEAVPISPDPRWMDGCLEWKRRYETKLPIDLIRTDCVDLFNFYEILSARMGEDDVFVLGTTGEACCIGYQFHKVKAGQRMFTSVCYGAMGWDLPALVGAAVAAGKRRSILVTGDGSILFNIHELMFVGMHGCNAKIFVANNNGYQSIRNTQDRYFAGRHVGADSQSGVANPCFESLASAFRVNYLRVDTNTDIPDAVGKVFADDRPWLVELMISREQQRFRIGSYRREDGSMASRPLEDMDPLLRREELESIMSRFSDD